MTTKPTLKPTHEAAWRVSAIAAVATAVGLLAGPSQARDEPIRIGWAAWADAEAVTKLAASLIEEHLDKDVELVLADIGLQYQGVANGDLDATMMSWQPWTHANYLDRVGTDLVQIGMVFSRGRGGWIVPDSIPRDMLSSIEDLNKPEVREKLGGRIQGIDPGAGLMQLSEDTIAAYGLDYDLVSASDAAMTAALDRAIRRDEWIVVTGWRPHWKFARYDLRYLEDPKGTLGGFERTHVVVRKEFFQDHPDVTELLDRMALPLDDLEAIIAQASQTSYEDAIRTYIDAHPARIRYWVTGEIEEP